MSKSTFRASNTPQGLAENMQILTGQRGDSLDKALTLREAAAIGIVRLRRNGSGAIVPELPPTPPTDPEWTGVQPPRAPVNVKAEGAFHTITLTWDAPTYHGHAFAEIWRAEKNNISTAVRVGTTLANVYSDAVGKGFKAFYWVRFVNKNSLPGPFHAQSGLFAETSKDIQDIIDGLDGQIKLSHFDGWLKKDYSGVKQDVASLESGVGYMWATKASAGEIKAGIGIVAKSDGTSQVFLAASQVFAYDPNNPNSSAPMFAIDQGKVVIQEALIRNATIQILKSEKITADFIKAGVSISAPLITGGQFDMGNAFMAGGAAGFGKGGPYSGWNWGWHTIIYSDGSIYTNRLNADGGYVRNMTIRNCTIEEDCVVKGTVYAERIVGDVVAVKSLAMPTPPFSVFDITFRVKAANAARMVVITGIGLRVRLGASGEKEVSSATFFCNGSQIHYQEVTAWGSYEDGIEVAGCTHLLPQGVDGDYTVRIKQYYGGVTDGAFLGGAMAIVTKQSSGTFG